jgi:hypothetical protein
VGGFLLARLEPFHFRTKRRYERALIEHSLRVSMAAGLGAEYSRTIKPPFHDIMRAVPRASRTRRL